MRKSCILFFLICLSMPFSAFSQNKDALKDGNSFFKKKDYYNAIVNYEVYLGMRLPRITYSPYHTTRKDAGASPDSIKEAENTIATSPLVTNKIGYSLAESYREVHHFKLAEACYARVLSKGSDTSYPLARYWYAECLRSNNKFEEARNQYQLLKNEYPTVDSIVKMADKEFTTLDYVDKQLKSYKSDRFSLKKLGGNLSQVEGAYAPILLKDTLLFTSARIVDTVNKNSNRNEHVNHLFYNLIATNDSILGTSTMIRFPSRLSVNEATAAVTPKHDKIFFARGTAAENGSLKVAIYTSNRIDTNTWSDPVKLGKEINKPGYNSMQPSVTDDGKYLLFVSDRDSGIGKLDIWAAALDENQKPGYPFNLKTINTKEDEMAPYYHNYTNTIVFASKGYGGMGGFDLFKANGNLENFQAPVNLEYPINSPKDDIYFCSSPTDSLFKKAFISSDRFSDCCLELFAFNELTKKKYKRSILTIINPCSDEDKPLPWKDIQVSIFNNGQNLPAPKLEYGKFFIEKGEEITSSTITANGYNPIELSLKMVSQPTDKDIIDTFTVCLSKIPPPPVPKTTEKITDSLENNEIPTVIYFDFDKSIIKDSSKFVLDRLVALLKRYSTISVSLDIHGFTDGKGSDAYNMRLGQRRAIATRQYLVDNGIESSRLELKSFGKLQPVAPNTIDGKDNPEGRALNRRAEMKIRPKK